MGLVGGEVGTPPVRLSDVDTRARTHLANERTFLAWLRTGLSLVAVGIAVAGFLPPNLVPNVPYVTAFAVALAVSGTGIVVYGGLRYRTAFEEIEAGKYIPTSATIVIVTIVVAILGILSVPLVFLLR